MSRIWRVLDPHPVASLGEYVDRGGGAACAAARQAPPDEVIDLVRSSGLRGRGGAGFPTGSKWATVAASGARDEETTVVVNAAEGEPGTFKDRALLRTNPYRVLEGAVVAALAMQSATVRVGIKATFGREIQRVESAISEMRAAGWLDGLDVGLVLGPSSYLFGEETALLEVVEGRQPFPRVTPPYRRGLQEDDSRSVVGVELASTEGDGGPPALVDNVETLADVALVVERGPEWFRQVGTDESPGTIVCTVSGSTRRSGVGEVPMGTSLREAIDLIGWGPRSGEQIGVVLAGTANALIPAELLDTPLTYEDMRSAGSGVGSAGFIVFNRATDPAAVAAGVSRFLGVESCGQCEPCKVDGLFIADQLRTSLHAGTAPIDLDELQRRIVTVTVGARCNLAQQQASVVGSLLELFPGAVTDRRRPPSESTEPVTIAPIADLVGGRAVLEPLQTSKQPDWSYDPIDSGAAPAARLGDTPVHIAERMDSRRWPEWSASLTTDHPLELVDDPHVEIASLIEAALAPDGHPDEHLEDVRLAVSTHIDVTQRVLYPMLRRVGGDDGEGLADAAEAQERVLSGLVDRTDVSDARATLRDIDVEMQVHAELEDRILELLRVRLDPIERSSLADGLAAARATSTVGRLRRSASKFAGPTREPSVRLPRPQVHAPSPTERAAEVPVAGAATADAATADGAMDAPALVDAAAGAVGSDVVAREPDVERLTDLTSDQPTAPPARPAAGPPTAPTDVRQPATPVPDPVRSVLVGVDGSDPAAAALGWAGRLAARLDADVIVGNVFEPGQAEIAPDDYDRLLAEAAERLEEEWSAPLRGTGVRHRSRELVGAPDRLLGEMDSEGIDLLVVGTRGAGRFAGLHLGSLAHHLAHHTRRPLGIVPVAGADEGFERIVVGVDGSPESLYAVAWCATVAAATGSEVVAVCAVHADGSHTDSSHMDSSHTDHAGGWREMAGEAISAGWTEPLRAADVAVRTRIVEAAHPVAALTGAAGEAGAGLLVVGTGRLNELTGLRLGHLPLQLVHHAHLPVVLVPPGPGV